MIKCDKGHFIAEGHEADIIGEFAVIYTELSNVLGENLMEATIEKN